MVSAVLRAAAFSLAGVALVAFTPAQASLLIELDRGHLRIEADQAPLGEILELIGVRLSINLKSNLPRDIAISGRFVGTLDEVLRRLFKGYDFVVVKQRQGDVLTVEINIHGRSSTVVAPPPPNLNNNVKGFNGFR